MPLGPHPPDSPKVGSRGRPPQSHCPCGVQGTLQNFLAILCSISSLTRQSRNPRGTPPRPGFTTEDAEDTEGLRVIPGAPRFVHQDLDELLGGRAPSLPMPGARRDREPVVDTVNPPCPPRPLWFNRGGGGRPWREGKSWIP